MWSTLAVGLAIVVGFVMSAVVPLPNVSMVFLLAVVFAAARFGIGPALLASGLSFLGLQLLLHRAVLYIYGRCGLIYQRLALFMFLAIAVLTSAIAGRAKEEATRAARLAEEIVRAHAAAETERVRNTLLASISHDFRTPLASILGAATSLIEYGARLPEPARRDLLAQVKDEAEHLDGMVRNLLAMTRRRGGGARAQPRLGRYAGAVRPGGGHGEAARSDPGVSTRGRGGTSLRLSPIRSCWIRRWPTWSAMRSAMRAPAARIALEARREGARSCCRSPTTGQAFPRTSCRTSSRSSRGRRSRAAMAARARGSASPSSRASSRRIGGSIAAAEPGRERARDADRDRLPLARRAHEPHPTRVLVVDDEPAIHRFLTPGARGERLRGAQGRDRRRALRRIAADAPDIVVLDLGLPDMDGKDVIARVREWSDVPIIVLSARDREAEKIAALDLGADDFVNKPFGVGELMARLRAALRHRMQRERRDAGRAASAAWRSTFRAAG